MLKTITMSAQEFDKVEENEKDHENIFYVFTDNNGDKYLVAHGKSGFIMTDHGLAYTAKEAYNRCIYKGFIEEGEHLNIICCYGGMIENYDNNITIINQDKAVCWINRTRLNNGSGRLVCFTKTNLVDRIKARIAIWA